MNPRTGFFWDDLMDEMLRDDFVGPAQAEPFAEEYVSPFNVGDVIVGEIVEETAELTTGEKVASL